METNDLITVENISRRYGKNLVVDDVSFSLKKGEVLGFLGPNGAGKSTTMKMICGILAPASGSIFINGIDLLSKPRKAKTQIGYLSETPPLYQDSTVLEYLKYCAQLRGMQNKYIAKAVAAVVERCNLGDVQKKLVGNISKGYQQRTGIAQAIIHAPKVLILDEPTVGLDPTQIIEIRGLIKELKEDRGVILSTHILPEAQQICDRIQIMNKGRLVYKDLESNKSSIQLVIRSKQPIQIEQLMDIDGVIAAEKDDDRKVIITVAEDKDIQGSIIRQSIEKGWGIQEMYYSQFQLEKIFVEHTCGSEIITEVA